MTVAVAVAQRAGLGEIDWASPVRSSGADLGELPRQGRVDLALRVPVPAEDPAIRPYADGGRQRRALSSPAHPDWIKTAINDRIHINYLMVGCGQDRFASQTAPGGFQVLG
jgi:hypothetical protein